MDTTPTAWTDKGYDFSFMAGRIPVIVERVLGDALLSFRHDPLVRDNLPGYVATRIEVRLREHFKRDYEVGYEGLILAGAEHFKIAEQVMRRFNREIPLLEQIAWAAHDPLDGEAA
jgi:hypothetical protein